MVQPQLHSAALKWREKAYNVHSSRGRVAGNRGEGRVSGPKKALTFYLLKRRRFYFLAHTCGQPDRS